MVESTRVEVDADAGFVLFKPVMKTDADRYNCTATNDVGSDSAVGQLRVLGMQVFSFPSSLL